MVSTGQPGKADATTMTNLSPTPNPEPSRDTPGISLTCPGSFGTRTTIEKHLGGNSVNHLTFSSNGTVKDSATTTKLDPAPPSKQDASGPVKPSIRASSITVASPQPPPARKIVADITASDKLSPVALNMQLLDTLFTFNHQSKLKEYLTAKTKVDKTFYKLGEVLTFLKNIIREEKQFDTSNPSIIVCDRELEMALDVKALHVTEVRDRVLSQMTKVPEPDIAKIPHTELCADSRIRWSAQTPKTINSVSISVNIPTDENARFTLKPDFMKVLHSVPGADTEQTIFSFGEVAALLSKYILSRKNDIFDPRNIKVALVEGDILGTCFQVRAFHRCQINNLIKKQLIPVDVGRTSAGTQSQSHALCNEPRATTKDAPQGVVINKVCPNEMGPSQCSDLSSEEESSSTYKNILKTLNELGKSTAESTGRVEAMILELTAINKATEDLASSIECDLPPKKERQTNLGPKNALNVSKPTQMIVFENKQLSRRAQKCSKQKDIMPIEEIRHLFAPPGGEGSSQKEQNIEASYDFPTKTNNSRVLDKKSVTKPLHTVGDSCQILLVPEEPPQADMIKSKKDSANENTNKPAIDCNCGKATNKKEFMDLASVLDKIFRTENPVPKCSKCTSCPSCKELATKLSSSIEPTQHEEEFIINSLIRFDTEEKRFCVELPFKKDPVTNLAPNQEQSKGFYKRIVKKLSNYPEDKKAILSSMNKQINLGFVEKFSSLPTEVQQSILSKQLYVIPWNVVWKPSSVSTPVRIVLNASSKTKTGKSLNDLLCKGLPQINLLPLALVLRRDQYLLTLDISKFYNSCKIPESQYHFQCLWWEDELDPEKEPELFIIKTHTYGVISSGRVLELCLLKMAEMNSDNEAFSSLFKNKTYVDDSFANCKTLSEAETLKRDCERILPEMGFKAKGYAISYENPPRDISDEVDGELAVGTIGMIWIPKRDVLRLKPPKLDFTGVMHRGKVICPVDFTGSCLKDLDDFVPKQLLLRSVASLVGKFWDPIGLAESWYLGVKHLLRLSSKAVSRDWNAFLPSDLRDMWVSKLWEMLELSKVDFPRCTFPLGLDYSELTVVGLSDMGLIGKLQCFYSLKKISEDRFHVELIYSRSQLSDKRSVPCQELDSLCESAITLEKICNALGNVDRKALLMDSTICAYWLMKDPVKLGVFQRLRVHNILSSCKTEDIFHIRSAWNSSDVGTKRPEPISCVLPGSLFSQGPHILQLGIVEAERKSFIKRIANVVLNPAVKDAALDGLANKEMSQLYLDSDTGRASCQVTPNNEGELSDPPKVCETLSSSQLSSSSSEPRSDIDATVLINNPTFVQRVKQRFDFHEYLVNPLSRPWTSAIRILAIALHFIRKLLMRRIGSKSVSESPRMYNIYVNLFKRTREPELTQCLENLCFQVEEDIPEVDVNAVVTPFTSGTRPREGPPRYTNIFQDIKDMKILKEVAVMYYLRMATHELEKFYSKTMLRKHAFLMDGIYYSKQRLLEVDNITDLMGDEQMTHELGIKSKLPCSDKYSPVGISIMIHHHRKVANHQGVDRTWVSVLSTAYIFQGQSMLSEIVRSCFHCRHKLRQRFKTSYGPINKLSLTFAAVNRHVMLDLSGPYTVRPTLHGRVTRNSSNKEKVYLLHTVCLTSFLNTIVIVEDYGSQAFTDAMHRIGARYGYPALAYTDASRAQLQSLLGTEFTMSDLSGKVYKETGVEIRVSGTGAQSHSRQGRVEKSIHCFQMFLENKQVDISSLTLIQFDSLINQAAAFLNSMPLCHKKRVGSTISSSLVSPYTFLLGRRSNSRAPADYPSLAESRGEILDNVALASKGMLNYFTAAIPDLLLRPDNYEESKAKIAEGDIVLFPYQDSEINTTYKLGLVTKLELDSDQKPRIVELAYTNSSEISLPVDHTDKTKLRSCCRFTRKGVHTLTKIYSSDDEDINTDIDLINKSLRQEDLIVAEDSGDEAPSDNHIVSEDPLTPDTTQTLIMSQLGYLLRRQ